MSTVHPREKSASCLSPPQTEGCLGPGPGGAAGPAPQAAGPAGGDPGQGQHHLYRRGAVHPHEEVHPPAGRRRPGPAGGGLAARCCLLTPPWGPRRSNQSIKLGHDPELGSHFREVGLGPGGGCSAGSRVTRLPAPPEDRLAAWGAVPSGPSGPSGPRGSGSLLRLAISLLITGTGHPLAAVLRLP